MLFLSSDMIKQAEIRAMENVSSMYLIENAAMALYEELKEFKSVRIYCGKGNNGSDGYATALLLQKNKIKTEIVQVHPPKSEECIFLAQEAAMANIPIVSVLTAPTEEFECVLDAIFGIGINGEVTDDSALKAIGLINISSSFVVSADIPSGLDADNGEICGECVKADKTITFTAPKTCMLSNNSIDLCGDIIIKDVGIPVNYTEIAADTSVPIEKKLARAILPPRNRYSHKGTFGTAVIVAGSSTMPGAAALAALAALRSGCGLVKIIAPVSIAKTLNIMVKEAIVIPAPEEGGIIKPALSQSAVKAINEADSILVGCGIGTGAHHLLIKNILANSSCGVIIDADGINALAGNLDIVRNKNVLLTPHPKEFSRISGISVADIENDRIKIADDFARENGVNLLLKGARTVITYGGSNRYVSLQSTSALSKAGSGDVLSGIIVSLSAQGLSLTDSAALASFIHTSAGMLAEKEIGAYGTIASDLIELIPRSIKNI